MAEFILRSGRKVDIDPKEVKEVSSSDDRGRYATITLFDGTIYKVANSFGWVIHKLSYKLK